ncbi:MAG: NAAT family transporter [Acidobacteriia bacterium]|nr:NAAT family transporter [Terriglobia bacterium]
MSGPFADVLQFSFVALTSIFFLVDPVAAVPTFLIMTAAADRDHRVRMARRAAWTCFIVLCSFAVAGSLIFRLFGITLPAFKIAGGLILILIGIDMLQARRSSTKETPKETQEGLEKDDVGIIPLGVPMLAGPGSISTVMVLMGGAPKWWFGIPILVTIAITAVSSYWILAAGDRVRGYLGETGIRILTRMMGLLLTAIAVQFMLNGLTDIGLVKGSQ